MTFLWEYDQDADLSFMTEAEQQEPHEVMVCIARYRDGVVAGCLGGIVDADRGYQRVIEAEMGWSKRTAYRKLDPQGSAKDRESRIRDKPEVPVRYDLMEQIVNAGFKAMSRAIHPDTGGYALHATEARPVSPRERIEAPETALLLADARGASDQTLTVAEAHVLEKDLARVSREYGRAVARVRKAKADLHKYISQGQHETAQLEPKRFERIMKKMLKKPKGGRP